MTLSKLSPTTFIMNLVALLSLMASLSPTVLIKDTGYNYETEENPMSVDRYRDLKCTYLIAAMKHMRLVKLLLEDQQMLTGAALGLASRFKIRVIICTLFNVPGVEIGSLWLLLFYGHTVVSYDKQYVLRRASVPDLIAALSTLKAIHNYVAKRIQTELTVARCRPGNRFDTYDTWDTEMKKRAKPSRKIYMKNIQTEGKYNSDELIKLLNVNNAEINYGGLDEALRSQELFINNLGDNTEMMFDLMNGYGVQVNWFGTVKMLENDFKCAQQMSSHTVILLPLFCIKKYYKGVFSLLKTIMHRLTWKFSLYVNRFTGERRGNYFKTWHDLLVQFQKLLFLQNDPETNSLLDAIDRLNINESAIDDIIEEFSSRLHTFNVTLLCDATNPMTLQPGQEAIESDSMKNANAFIAKLQATFQIVNFDVIRSIMLYIENEAKFA